MYQQGTPFFMPYEIHSSILVDAPQVKLLPLQQVKPFTHRQTKVELPRDEQAPCPVKFRFQHDLESLWWVMIWIVLYRVGGEDALRLVKMIFTYSRVPSIPRARFFLYRTPDLNAHLDTQLEALAPFFVEIQKILLSLYSSKETTGNLPAYVEYGKIYEQVWTALTHVFALVAEIQDVTFLDPDLEQVDPELEPETAEMKTKKRKSKVKDDHDFRPNRQGSIRGKATPTGPADRPRRSVRVSRRQVG